MKLVDILITWRVFEDYFELCLSKVEGKERYRERER